MRWCLALVSTCLAMPVAAQTLAEIPDEVTQSAYIENLPTGQVRLWATGLDQAVVDAMAEYDHADLFDFSNLDAETIPEVDWILVVRPTWPDVHDAWIEIGAPSVASSIPLDLISQLEAYGRSGSVTMAQGALLRFESVTTTFNGVDISPDCLAQYLVERVYRGPENSAFDAVVCAAAQS